MTYQFDCRATELDVRQVLIDLRAALADVVAGDDVRSSVEIAVAEGLNNVVEHSLTASCDGRIHVRMGVDAAHVFVLLQDPGAPYPNWALPDAPQVDLDVPLAELPEGGFGWGMIHALTDRLDYSRVSGMNCLKMWFARGS